MTDFITIAPRYCGPPDSGNGGYTCGLVAGWIDGPAQVTLRRPPPLDTPLAVERDDNRVVRVLVGDTLIAEGEPASAGETLAVPEPVSVAQAATASAASYFRLHPDEHPFPTCFVCGPEREPRDGLRILVGPVPDREVSADVWHPDEALAGSDGNVRPEFLWAALDCSGGLGAIGDASPNGPPFVLGRLSVRQLAPVRVGEPYVALGWRLGAEGRKLTAGSALFTASGEAVGLAQATWIRLA